MSRQTELPTTSPEEAGFSGDPWGLFLKMARAQRGKYGAYVDTGKHVICSASPELFFTRNGLHPRAKHSFIRPTG